MDDSQVASVLDSADDQTGSPNVKAVCAYLGGVIGSATNCGGCAKGTALEVHECKYPGQRFASTIGKVRRWRGVPIDLETGERETADLWCCYGCPHNSTQPDRGQRSSSKLTRAAARLKALGVELTDSGYVVGGELLPIGRLSVEQLDAILGHLRALTG